MRGWAVSGLQRQGKLGNDKEGKPEGSTLTPHVSPYVTPKSLSLLGDREVDRRKEFCATACFGRKNGVTSSSHNLGSPSWLQPQPPHPPLSSRPLSLLLILVA